MDPTSPEPGGYWYEPDIGDDTIVGLLAAVRTFRRADAGMRRRLGAEMDMNGTDLHALQLLIAAQARGDAVTPRALSAHLAISTASTTKLLHRLTASGHLTRAPHPTDRRSLVVVPTAHAHQEVRERLAGMHARMAEVAGGVPVEARAAVVDFLRAMAALLDAEVPPAPLAPRTPRA
ncbi:MarR family winged helix-turn-helix transcriptional regulator [Cellulomonas fimi]|uniref:Winged helix-turn-helix transcriptional regulator n=1 Tax=Cellulomonas fimi TaxID=1708 RepID=A0A7Y0LVN3_CELFI|nr:MarR family winged helix-turn-helix transcriptional regulator [Cellulomonas fimi]NMR19091.1 winged helix-turn-helix transcriptional regulator [Cellulomonas fimi]